MDYRIKTPHCRDVNKAELNASWNLEGMSHDTKPLRFLTSGIVLLQPRLHSAQFPWPEPGRYQGLFRETP